MESSNGGLKATESFSRKTYKFIIHQNDIQSILEILEEQCIQIKYSTNMTNVQTVSSVYYDDANHNCYMSRLEKEPNNDIMRIRTYNHNNSQIYMEIKSNNSMNKDKTPIKERLVVNPEDLKNIVSCKGYTFNTDSAIADRISYLIHTRNVKPKVIIEYNRATFEKHGMRITVDFDMKGQKVNSDNILNNLTINDSKSNTCGIFRLNYALLEVKTDNNLNPTDCIPIKSLLRKNLIRPLNAFSKFITVYYFYYSNQLNIRPFWFSSMVGDAYCHNSKNIFPITLKPNTFTSIEALFYRIFNIVIGIPLTLLKYSEITEHKPFLLKPNILKHYLITCLILNLMTFCKVKNRLLNKTINHIGTVFPILVTLIFILSLII